MKKILKLMICIVILLFVVVGRFYYSVYASEYDCDLSNDDSLNIDDFDSLRIGSYNIKSLNYGKESLEDFGAGIEAKKLPLATILGSMSIENNIQDIR